MADTQTPSLPRPAACRVEQADSGITLEWNEAGSPLHFKIVCRTAASTEQLEALQNQLERAHFEAQTTLR